MEGDDRTFTANFTIEGDARLRKIVNVKLKEFMGDYTDETLVEYVIVLLKNGRRKDEANRELNVFLGDDSDSFVSWLWDHLGSNLSLYVQQWELQADESPTITSATEEQDERTESHQIDSDSGEGRKTSRKHQTREREGLVRNGDENENPLTRSSIPHNINSQDGPHQGVGRIKRALYPRPTMEKKRRRHEQRRSGKTEVSRTSVSAPRRLLQFAVRDAVASGPTNSTAGPSFMRLQSLASTSTGNSFLKEHPHRNQPELGLRTGMSAVIKAMAEAVQDVNNIKPPRKVFDRLGHATDVSNYTNHLEESRSHAEDGVGGDFIGERVDIDLAYQQQNGDYMEREGNLFLHDATNMSSDLVYDGEGYDDADAIGQGATDVYHPGASGGVWLEDSLVFHYSSTDDADEEVRKPREDLDQHASQPIASLKIASSINMSNRKPQYQDVREVSKMDNYKLTQDRDTEAAESQVCRLMKENSGPRVPFNGKATPEMGPQYQSKKARMQTDTCSTGPPTEDADSRTILVGNVHFAASKDSLSRHFNKSGEVLKVIILTDPFTGQPKGSACIEFMRREAAEQALSLNGTSFMSRILKIVRKTSAPPGASASVMMPPHISRASPPVVPGFGRVPFVRGVPSLYRPRIQIKPGARSFQWKREAQPTVTEASGQTPNSIVRPPPVRSLKYIRRET